MPRRLLILFAASALCLNARAAELTVGWISRSPEIPYVWNSSNPRVEGWPAAGAPVTWRGHVRNSSDAPHTVQYVWRLNGTVVAQGEVTLAANAYSTIDLPHAWSFTRERLSLTIDSKNVVSEESERNNTLEIFTDALAVGFWVEQSLYDHFRANQHRLGIGSTSFEDFAQRLIAYQNDLFAMAVYDVTPHGVLDRWRLQKLVIVPDAALPLTPPADEILEDEPSAAASQPDSSDRTIDLQWGFHAGVLPGYRNYEASGVSNPFDIPAILLHELGHARYLTDVYAFDVSAVSPSTIEVPGVETIAGFAFRTPDQGLMNRDFTFVDRHSAGALNRIAGHRAVSGSYVSPENIEAYLNDLPAENRLTLRDAEGNLLRDWAVDIHQSKPRQGDKWYTTHYETLPDLRLHTDANGQLLAGRNPFASIGPVVHTWGGSNAVALVRATNGAETKIGFLEARTFNLASWAGHTMLADHEVIVGREVPCGNRGPMLVSPTWDASHETPAVTFRWRSLNGAVSYDVYTASPEKPQPRLLGTTTATELAASVTGGRAYWWVEARFANSCPPLRSNSSRIETPPSPSRPGKRRAVR